MGEKQVKSSRQLFQKNKIPSFDTPEKAIAAFSYLADYYQNQKLSSFALEPFSFEKKSDISSAKKIINTALNENRYVLTLLESKNILEAFFIKTTKTYVVKNENEIEILSKSLSFSIVMKIYSFDITHKQDVGGVELNVSNVESAKVAYKKIINNAKNACPEAKIFGVTIEPYEKSPNNREVMIGVTHDNVFGSVISFGAGGSFVEIMKDRGLALPPLNRFIAML